MEERAVTIQKIAEVLNMSVNEVEELCKNNKIPFHITDPGTAWEAKRFYAEEVLKAVKPKKEEAEEEPVKEEPNPLAEEKAKEEEKPAEEPKAEKEPPKKAETKPEGKSAEEPKAEKEPVKEESSKKTKTNPEDPL